jgi:glycosyltransferase involved in cell wall biosynthesis
MSEKVMILLNDEKLRRRFGENGRSLVGEKYSLERLVGEMSDLYRELSDQYNG